MSAQIPVLLLPPGPAPKRRALTARPPERQAPIPADDDITEWMSFDPAAYLPRLDGTDPMTDE